MTVDCRNVLIAQIFRFLEINDIEFYLLKVFRLTTLIENQQISINSSSITVKRESNLARMLIFVAFFHFGVHLYQFLGYPKMLCFVFKNFYLG